MFNLFRKIFNKKEDKKPLGYQSIDFNFQKWLKKIKNDSYIDSELLNELEIFFIKFDIGIETSSLLISQIKEKIKGKKISNSDFFLSLIKKTIFDFYKKSSYNHKTNIIQSEKNKKLYLFVGVNGAGKTTTIGKIASIFKKKEKKVLLVAGDIFRDGAIEQLQEWSKTTKSEIFYEYNINNKKKTSKLFFNALKYAENKNFDVILCDTSGRLQNNINLMKELGKIKKILDNNFIFKNSYKTFLVIDSMTGQNSFNQVELFNKILPIDSIILTKFDNISKAGIILNIKHLYNLETEYLGIGEKNDDLIDFNIKDYIEYLLS
ncbi:signal recognition particle-docking protein FtsY [Candidatus Phytoplasma oryzae]|nr:signal recognition particle-docking protein FtsY [Candidatus Phytoplasma oryzae]